MIVLMCKIACVAFAAPMLVLLRYAFQLVTEFIQDRDLTSAAAAFLLFLAIAALIGLAVAAFIAL